MAIKFSDKVHNKLDISLGSILDAHANGEVTKAQAVAALAHLIAAAAKDNESEVKSWCKPDVIARWKEAAIANRA
jgi:hypothetical protein